MQNIRSYLRLAALGLLIYMPLHIFLAQSLSLVTGGLGPWKVTKDVVLFALTLTGVSLLLIYQRRQLPSLFWKLLGFTTAYGLLHLTFLISEPSLDKPSVLLGSVYNNRIFWSLLFGYMCVWGLKARELNKWQHIITTLALGVAVAVAVLGIIQYFLPPDFMTNFGYGVERGTKAYFAIDDKMDLPRVFSTLRDPNSLGAFLLLPIALLGQQLVKNYRQNHRHTIWHAAGLLVLLGALLLTFSRSAWLGTAIVIGVVVVSRAREQQWRMPWKKFLVITGICIALLSSAIFLLRDHYIVQNVVFHADETTTLRDPNEKRLQYFQNSIEAVVDKPSGHGPGTAGLVAIRNPEGGILPENYYLQIAYEVGWLGVALFIYIQILVYKQLSKRSSPLSSALRASFWGLLVSSLLLHTWSNEAVMYSWWLLAGVVLTSRPYKHRPQSS